VAAALDGVSVREPRITAFCSTTGLAYSTLATVREALPGATCAGAPSPSHWEQLALAVAQQGYGRLVDVLGEHDADTSEQLN
jgi:hypothetical protein